MKLQIVILLVGVAALALARPSDIVDFENDLGEHEQEGVAGKAVEGEYTWLDANGEEYTIKYIADHLGYRVLDSDNVDALDTDAVEEVEEDE